MGEDGSVLQPCDWLPADDCSSKGLESGVENEDRMIDVDVEAIFRMLDEEPDSTEVSHKNLTQVGSSASESNSLLPSGYQATGWCHQGNSYGSTTSQTEIAVPRVWNGLGNGVLGPSAPCFSDYGGNVVSYPLNCGYGTVANLNDKSVDSKFTPYISTMVTPYFNTIPGNGAGIGTTENSSVMSHSSHNSSFNTDCADICASSAPSGHHTIDASLSEVFPNFVPSYTYPFFPTKEDSVNDMESGLTECQPDGGSIKHDGISEINLAPDFSSGREFNIKCEIVSPVSYDFDGHQVDKELEHPYNYSSSFLENEAVDMKVKPDVELEDVYSSLPRKDSMCTDVHTVGAMRKQWNGFSNCAASYQTSVGREYSFMAPKADFPGLDCFDSDDCSQYIADPDPVTPWTKYFDFPVGGEENECIQLERASFNASSFSAGKVESLSSEYIPARDDDADIYGVESKDESVNPHQFLDVQRPVFSSEHSIFSQPFKNCGGLNLQPNMGSKIFQAALQDLSQPISEASPPDGVLAVPLLRHQRIALAWMSQKETTGDPCFGGFLADDQGLGKTVSTIALILTERFTPSLPCEEDTKNGGSEQCDQSEVVSNENEVDEDSLCKMKEMPAAGTLIVCPTSLMRQWADELCKKVTPEANLSVLVYHGCSRTKDPHELAKYDVVITSYPIVSMEVPKQPLVGKENEEKGGLYDGGVLKQSLVDKDNEKPSIHDERVETVGSDTNKKDPPNSRKRVSKKRKHGDCESVVSLYGPLSKVSWFRVVLDEAQSIKNYKTQVSRACWGLHAKRRWCLSGTPIQNSIDDLYSYFRFLNFAPYYSFSLFRESIKNPINKDPRNGYQKLQAILKTIMLRRTKDTLLDGKPIISLPPKSIELRKVDFSKEERDFYTKLECDSRDQYKEYADAGTVQQNYVNILLMLLRLRQACGHPLLVSSSSWKSSVEVAKKLPYEKQTFLLNCLEASLTICGICDKAPEDAVVSVCGHVFCKQCICECLTGDNSQCPLSNCKVGLEISSLFSKETLDNALLGDAPCDRSSSDPVGTSEPCFENVPCSSSKIKAALDILESLNKPQSSTTISNDLNQSSQNGENQQLDNDNSSSLPETPVTSSVDGLVKVVAEKAIVFSQWTKMLDLVEACLKSSCIEYRRFDGKMTVAARDEAVQDFNTLPEVSVMIMSLKAASLGLNMVAACHVLMLDLWWNPTTEDQAIDRAHRIGQTRPVKVVRFTVKDTVEDRILALQQKKRMMVASAFGEDEKGTRQSHLSVEDLNYLFLADI